MVEDGHRTADFLSLYNINIGLDEEQYLPSGTFLAIRAPYYKWSAGGSYTLRVDHPSDVVKLDNTHPFVRTFNLSQHAIRQQNLPGFLRSLLPVQPAGIVSGTGRVLETEQDLTGLKEDGNELFRGQKYHAASEKYSEAIRSPSLEVGSDLWNKLFCNRAVVRLCMSQFDGAIRDCEEILKITQNHIKATLLKARTLYRLRRFEEAQRLCYDFLAIEPTSEDGNGILASATERIRESTSGEFDFKEMELKAKAHKYPRLDYADFVGPVEIRQCDPSSKGRGLFATRNINQGELVICEKAFMIGYAGEKKGLMSIALHTEKMRCYKGPESYLPSETMQLLSDNPSLAPRLLALYSGDGSTSTQPLQMTAEGAPVISAFTVFNIWDHNTFKAEYLADQILSSSVEDKTDVYGSTAGLWVQSSYINHKCTGNADRAFVGDLAIVRASRSIKAGEEMLFSYVPPFDPIKEKERILQELGFTCTCELCTWQRSIPAKECRARNRALRVFDEFVERKLKAGPTSSTPSLVLSQLRQLSKAILKTYSDPVFCAELIKPYLLLFKTQYALGMMQDCVIALRNILTLVTGASAEPLGAFEPVVWCPEMMLCLLGLCILFEEIGEQQEAQRVRDIAATFWGNVSGFGKENVDIGEVLQRYKLGLFQGGA